MKTYFNDAIIGNSKMLACLDRKGELVRLFWPHIDYPQHIESFQIGLYFPGKTHSTTWLQHDEWQHKQHYIQDTNILKTTYISDTIGFEIVLTDFAVMDKDVLIRSIEIENISGQDQSINMLAFSNFISNTTDLRSTLFDFDEDCLIHYRHDYYIAVAGSAQVVEFQIGNNPYEAARSSAFYGGDDIGMTGEAVQAWELGCFAPHEKKRLDIFICCSHSLKGCVQSVRKIKQYDIGALTLQTQQYWLDYLKRGKCVTTNSSELDALYRRSLLVFKLMSNTVSGGLLAAPELDEHFTRCGRYAYCWGRDAAFITSALDQAGYCDLVDKFYQWVAYTQNENGSWHQRYYLDGNLAPSWGLQIDETGTLLWGVLQHYYVTDDKGFLNWMWNYIKTGASFLVEFIDPENHLPKATYDLWEERVGQHTYSAAAVYAGLRSAVEINKILAKQDPERTRWAHAADEVKQAIEKHLWNSERQVFYRGLHSTVNGWGFEGHGGKKEIVVNPKGYKRWVSNYDIVIDVSLLGIEVPFEVFGDGDKRVMQTAMSIEQNLTSYDMGGVRRYENDSYMGGNPWILTTLWMALYHIRTHNSAKAKEYLLWALQHKTSLGLLPEQVDRETGKPAWVVPLTWSHAMYVLVYLALAEEKIL